MLFELLTGMVSGVDSEVERVELGLQDHVQLTGTQLALPEDDLDN